jgi:hypothetical protein
MVTYTNDGFSLQEAASNANTNPTIGWSEQSSSSLNQIYALLLIKATENHVTLTYFHIYMPPASGYTD